MEFLALSCARKGPGEVDLGGLLRPQCWVFNACLLVSSYTIFARKGGTPYCNLISWGKASAAQSVVEEKWPQQEGSSHGLGLPASRKPALAKTDRGSSLVTAGKSGSFASCKHPRKQSRARRRPRSFLFLVLQSTRSGRHLNHRDDN